MKELGSISSKLQHIPKLDVEYAIDSMGGSEALYEETLMRMVRQIPSNIGEMDAFLDSNGDLSAFAIKVHGVKGVLRHVGKTALANDAESLELAAKAGNKTYCAEHYESFKKDLLCFRDQISAALEPETGNTEAEPFHSGSISDFIDTLKQAEEAADLCDSMAAYEILLPLTKIHFGGDIDNLISNAATALDQFKPFEAFECITELLNVSENRL